MRRDLVASLLGGLLVASAQAQTLQALRATTIEAAPPAQVATAEATLQRLRSALRQCDGGVLEGLLPPWEQRLLPLLAFDATRDTQPGQVAGLSREELALSPYGRAAVELRAAGLTAGAGAGAVLSGWCRANAPIVQALLADLQVDRWQWLRQDELQMLSGCATRPVADGRISLLGSAGRWQFALLESVENLVGEGLAGPDPAVREALLAARRDFLDRYPGWPAAPQAPDLDGRQALLQATVATDEVLDRFATLIEQRAALPPCR